MKYFKTYESFKETGFLTDPAEIKAWLDSNLKNRRHYIIEKDGVVNVNGNVDLSGMKLKKILVQFGKVDEYFWCSNNQLTNLKGAPEKIGGSFWCDHNQLTSLEGAPKKVDTNFFCDSNLLVNLKGVPKKINGVFGCNNNRLTSLEGAPEEVGGDFCCNDNRLINLVGMPKVKGDVEFESNSGVPSEILKEVYELMKKNKTDWDMEIKKYIQTDPTVTKYLPKEELKRLGLDKENRLKSGGLI